MTQPFRQHHHIGAVVFVIVDYEYFRHCFIFRRPGFQCLAL